MNTKNITVNISLAGEIDMEKIRQEFDKAVRAEIDRVGVNVEVSTKQPETITHEGVDYKRVDREAREGDVVVLMETTSDFFTNGVIYGPVRDGKIPDNDGDYLTLYKEANNRTPANVKVYEPIVAKPAPLQVGDYAKVVPHNNDNCFGGAVGDIVKVIRVSNEGYRVEELDGGNYCGTPNAKKEALVRATDEEVAEAKQAKRWADIGRKPNEFKVGDAIRYKKAFTTVTYVGADYVRINQSSNVERNIAVNPADLTLVFPVESKFGGDSE
jgi:hypothetical protein